MQISIATTNDIPTLINLSQDLVKTTNYRFLDFSSKRLSDVLTNGINQDPSKSICLIGKVDGQIVGTIAGAVGQSAFSDDLIASEWLWWGKPELGKRQLLKLLDGFEYWAKHIAKCKAMLVGRMHFKSQPEDYFSRHGYVKSEEFYLKEL